MEMSQSYNAHPCVELVAGGRFSEVLKIWSSDMSREDFEGWLLPTKTEADMRIVLHARNATVRRYSQQVNVLCRDTVVLNSLFAHW